MILTLIRHTKVEVDKTICYGFTDIDVAFDFNDDAQAVFAQLPDKNPVVVFSSPLQRCTKLTEYLFKDVNYIIDDRLKELNFGFWEMKPWKKISESKEGKLWMDNFVTMNCPDGESFEEQYKRVIDFYKDEIQSKTYKSATIIAHGGTIRALLCYLQNVKLDKAFEFKIEYGSITIVEVQN